MVSCGINKQKLYKNTMKKKIEEIKEAIYNCGDEYAENREQVRRAINSLEELEKQFYLQGVGCSLPSKEEISLEFAEITKQDNKVGCPKNESEAYKRGFIHGTIFKRTKVKSDI